MFCGFLSLVLVLCIRYLRSVVLLNVGRSMNVGTMQASHKGQVVRLSLTHLGWLP